ncbi:hypothetical protein AAZX31_18G164200 [Glycine max]|uniref:Uncharacterized protein n=1 Tax=Glycine max TaxID=3847 RepID=A0A0R0F190_SOYBN|nr:hypothetical protein JHK86_050685 [Glycine max]KAG4936607.1 hypothetical protein JHK85_051526 [Glycine max]KAG5092051.1 hypothetical protein JHK82_050829 [Glycine max]KAG5095132.1 hypothetical protein JHK84_050720 [Glycine max]KAH1154997.1 hypothetical protein GYH30_050338 [Glycine max]
MSELTNEEHEQCCKMAKIMLKVTVPSEIYGKVSRSFAVRWKDVLDRYWHLLDKDGNLHIVLYNQDLDILAIVAWWTTLRDFYHMTGEIINSSHPKSFPRWHSLYHQVPNSVTFNVLLTQHKITCSSLDVPSTMYYFLKDKGWTRLNLEDITQCQIVFNHLRKTAKIGARWKYFCETQSFKADMEIVFEFPDPIVNYVLFWPCL